MASHDGLRVDLTLVGKPVTLNLISEGVFRVFRYLRLTSAEGWNGQRRAKASRGGGEIPAAELQQGMMQIGEEVSPEELQAMMAVVDVDGSGSVNYDEFAPVGKIADGLKRLERSFAQEKVNREHADRKALQLGQRIDEIDAQIAAWSA